MPKLTDARRFQEQVLGVFSDGYSDNSFDCSAVFGQAARPPSAAIQLSGPGLRLDFPA